MGKQLKNKNGFSLVELILALLLGVLFVGFGAKLVTDNIDLYTGMTARKASLADTRQAIDRMSYELRLVQENGITNISPTEIYFMDAQGQNTSFRLGTNGPALSIYRGNDLIVDRVSSFVVNYYDANGTEILPAPNTITDVKRIKLNIVTDEVNNEGNIVLSTMVIPRNFIGYSNYHY